MLPAIAIIIFFALDISTIVLLLKGRTAPNGKIFTKIGTILGCVLLSVLCITMFGFWIYSLGFEAVIPIALIIGGIAAVIGIVLVDKKKKKEAAYLAMLQNQYNFYNKCRKLGVESISDKESLRKATRVASTYGFCTPELVKEYFDSGRKMYEEEARERWEEWRREKRESEEREYNELSRFLNFAPGTEKRVEMLTAQIENTKRRFHLDTMQRVSNGEADAKLERERDWALAGGIAEGIGGLGVGLAVAADVQRENEEIRKRNAERIQFDANLHAQASKVLMYAKSECEKIARKIDEAIVARYSTDIPSETLMKYVDLTDFEIKISEMSAFTVTAKVGHISSSDNVLPVFEEGGRVTIDGYITVRLFQNGKVVGDACMALPVDGTYSGIDEKVKIKGICLSGAVKDSEYTYELIPNLWLMEI